MKHFLFSLLFLLIQGILLGQTPTPEVINYQAAIKNNEGTPLANREVSVNISISSDGGGFSTTQTATTDAFGIVNLQLGGPEMKMIDWSKGNARVSVSIASGSTSVSLGTTQLATVPYALYAEKSGSSLPGPAPRHQWDGTRLRFEKADGSLGDWVDLKGERGNSVKVVGSLPFESDLDNNYTGEEGDLLIIEDTGDGHVWDGEKWLNVGQIQGPEGPEGPEGPMGEKGERPLHEWDGTFIRFQNPDGSWGEYMDLLGPEGDKGDIPNHQWMGSRLRFENPDGSWGTYTDLIGPPGNAGNYNAGPGIDIVNNTIINSGDRESGDDLTISTEFEGDITGKYNSTVVSKIKGKTISNQVPVEGDVMTYTNGVWKPEQPTGGGPSGIAAGTTDFNGNLVFGTGGVSASASNNIITVSLNGVSLSSSNCSVVATSLDDNASPVSVFFSGGNAILVKGANNAAVCFMIYY